MEYEEGDKFKIADGGRAKITEVFEDSEDYQLLIIDDEGEYDYFASREELEDDDEWKKDNRIKVE